MDLAKKALKVPADTIIEAYSELSESEAEVYYIEEEFKGFKKLEEKYKKMQVVKKEYEKLLVKLEKERKAKEKLEEKLRKEEEKRLAEEERKRALEKIAEAILIEKAKNEEKLEKPIKKEKTNIEKIEKTVKEKKSKKTTKKELEKITEEKNIDEIVIEEVQENIIPLKEHVNPLIFSWLEREDFTLTKKVGSKKLVEFFNKIKEIEERTGIRVSLYIVSNAGREVTLKRLKDFKKKAIQNKLPNLVEGALGGYSSFRIDSDENIIEISKMPLDIREEIIEIIEKIKGVAITRDFIENSEEEYIRYDLTNKREKEITKKYLNLLISKILKDENINEMSLKVLAFMEGNKAGIDILMQDQIKGISQISEYYKEKYIVTPEKIMNTKIDGIDNFINE